jgi:hypothetical protein
MKQTRLSLRAMLAASLLTLSLLLGVGTAFAAGSNSLAINQVYLVGGASTNSPYTGSYIELVNRGPVPVDLTDWVIQYQSTTGNFGPSNTWFIAGNSAYTSNSVNYPANTLTACGAPTPTVPCFNNGFTGVLQPGQYYLIRMPSGTTTGNTRDFPNLTPDIDLKAGKNMQNGSIAKFSTSGGKFAIIKSLSGIVTPTSTVPAPAGTTNPYYSSPYAADFIGYRSDSGINPSTFEGTNYAYIKPLTAVSNSKNNVALTRSSDICNAAYDTDNNGGALVSDQVTYPGGTTIVDLSMVVVGASTSPTPPTNWVLHNSKDYSLNDVIQTPTYTPQVCYQTTTNPTITGAATAIPLNASGAANTTTLTVQMTNAGANPATVHFFSAKADLSGLPVVAGSTPYSSAQSLYDDGPNQTHGDAVVGDGIWTTVLTCGLAPSPCLDTTVSGTYVIPITVMDDAGRTVTTTATLQIGNPTPVDTTPPVLTSVDFTPKQLSDGTTLNVTLTATDDISGVVNALATFTSPSAATTIPVILTRTSGTALNGTWTGTTVMPGGSEKGAWTLSEVDLTDAAANPAVYNAAALQALGAPGQLLVNTTLQSQVAVRLGDFSGDHRADLTWYNEADGHTVVWQTDNLQIAGYLLEWTVADTNWHLVGNADLNGDGKSDLLWRNSSTGANYVWITNGSWFDGLPLEPVADTNWQIAGTGDFDADGKTDILWRNNQTGDNTIWFMDGNVLTSGNGIQNVPSQDWQIVAVADFNGDGKADILWRNLANGTVLVWFMDGRNLVSTGSPGTVADLNWSIAAVADFDGDHKAEILWRNRNTGDDYMWMLNNDGTLASGAGVQAVADANWKLAATGDINGDGKADLVWRNKSTGANYVWFMNGPTLVNSGPLEPVPDQTWKLY